MVIISNWLHLTASQITATCCYFDIFKYQHRLQIFCNPLNMNCWKFETLPLLLILLATHFVIVTNIMLFLKKIESFHVSSGSLNFAIWWVNDLATTTKCERNGSILWKSVLLQLCVAKEYVTKRYGGNQTIWNYTLFWLPR